MIGLITCCDVSLEMNPSQTDSGPEVFSCGQQSKHTWNKDFKGRKCNMNQCSKKQHAELMQTQRGGAKVEHTLSLTTTNPLMLNQHRAQRLCWFMFSGSVQIFLSSGKKTAIL